MSVSHHSHFEFAYIDISQPRFTCNDNRSPNSKPGKSINKRSAQRPVLRSKSRLLTASLNVLMVRSVLIDSAKKWSSLMDESRVLEGRPRRARTKDEFRLLVKLHTTKAFPSFTGAHRMLGALLLVLASACTDGSGPFGAPDASVVEDAAVPAPDANFDDAGAGVEDGGFDDPDSGVADAGLSSLAEICDGIEPTTLEEYENCRFRAFCGFLARCEAFGFYASVDDCLNNHDEVTFGSISYIRTRLEAASDDGRVSLDRPAFERCIRRLLDESTCYSGQIPDCIGRWVGQATDGEACEIDAECAPTGSRCIRTCEDQCCAGTCRASAGVGEACGAQRRCAAGLHCADTGESFECISGDRGTRCYKAFDCDVDSWCEDGTCVADLPTGSRCSTLSACNGLDQCIGVFALPEPRCESTSMVGDRCDFGCMGPLWCDQTAGPIGTCRALPIEGEDCSLSQRCFGSNLYCNAQRRCAPRVAEGASCMNDSCARGTVCTSTTGQQDLCLPREQCLPEF